MYMNETIETHLIFFFSNRITINYINLFFNNTEKKKNSLKNQLHVIITINDSIYKHEK